MESRCNTFFECTVHQAPPDAFAEYQLLMEGIGARWILPILHPRLEVAIQRDQLCSGWHSGAARVELLRRIFEGDSFPETWSIDSSDQTPLQTAVLLLKAVKQFGSWHER